MNEREERILVIAPHPDDETLGCGGTLRRHVAEGREVHWLIVTEMLEAHGYEPRRIRQRAREIERVAEAYGFHRVHQAGFPAAEIDSLPKGRIVEAVSSVLEEVRPDTVYLPYRNDVHSDHAVVFDAAVAAGKIFRHPSLKRIYAYETLSETEFGLRPDDPGFRPNLFIDITPYLDEKVRIMKIYRSELGRHPFPRSVQSLRAMATLRGTQAGVEAAEAFMVLREIR